MRILKSLPFLPQLALLKKEGRKVSHPSEPSHPWGAPTAIALSVFSWLLLPLTSPVAAQPIFPAADGTGTTVIPNGHRYDVGGGTLSEDGVNLFHSFEQFGLNSQQTVNFLSNSQIQNILGRVVGGDPSTINGLIQVSGGNANLYLLNPAGIVFGSGASLNIPADFFATTATAVGFGQTWFNAYGNNDYPNLVGAPSQFAFDLSQAGAIVNAGTLSVREGYSLTLLSGTVVNTGTLSAPGGNIVLTAVPGSSLVKVSQPGSLLSLELDLPRDVSGNILPFSALDLPQLLAGVDVETELVVSADGTIALRHSDQQIPTGQGSVVASGTLDVSSSSLAGGSIDIVGTQVGAIAAHFNASGVHGGTIRIGGDYQGSGTIPNALRTAISPNTTLAANATAADGNGGRIIVWADEITGFYGKLSALGENSGGFAEISGKNSLIFQGQIDVGNNGTVLFDPTNITIVPGNGADDDQLKLNQPTIDDPIGHIFRDDGGIVDFVIGANTLETINGNIELQATNNISVDPAITFLTLLAPTGMEPRQITLTADADGMNGGDFIMAPTQSIIAPGSNLTISGANVTVGNIEVEDDDRPAGDVSLTATSGNLNVGNISTSARGTLMNAGSIKLSATEGEIRTGNLDAIALPGLGNGGNIEISARDSVETGTIQAFAETGTGGSVSLSSASSSLSFGNITTNDNSIDLQGTVVLNQNTLISNRNTSGDIKFTQTVEGPFNLDINAGSGNVTFTGAVGSATALGTLSINSTGTTQFQDTVNAASIITDAGGTTHLYGDVTANGGGGQSYGDRVMIEQNLSLTGDAIGFRETVSGQDRNLTLQPFTSDRAIVLGGMGMGGSTALNLSNRDLNDLENGFNFITIGRSDGSGTITLAGDATFVDSLFLRSPNGLIDTTGATLRGEDNATLTLFANRILTGSIINPGRDITLNSSSAIDTSAGALDASGSNGGSVALKAATDLTTGLIEASGSAGQGGNVTLGAQGAIQAGGITVRGETNGGSVNLGAAANLTTGSIETSGNTGRGGNVTLNSLGQLQVGEISTQGGTNGGIVDFKAAANLTTGSIETSGNTGRGGNVTLNSLGQLQVGEISAQGGTNGGDVTLDTQRNLQVGAINTQGGADGGRVKLEAPTGSMTTSAIETLGNTGSGGNITLNSQLRMETGNITTRGGTRGGDATLKTQSHLQVGAISTQGGTDGGDVTLDTQGQLQVGGIRTQGGTRGGNVSLDTQRNLQVGAINTQGGTDGGSVTLKAPTGSITTSAIETLGTTGQGGNTNLNAQLRMEAGNITANGGTRGGNVTLDTQSDLQVGAISTQGGTDGGSVNLGAATNLTTGQIEASGNAGQGGNVTLDTQGQLQVGGISTQGGTRGGNVSLDTQRNLQVGAISTQGGTNGGIVNLEAAANLTTGSIETSGNAGRGGDVTLNSLGQLQVGGITARGGTDGGNVTLDTQEQLQVGGIITQGGTDGGIVNLEAATNLTTGSIETRGNAGRGGNVTLNSLGELQVGWINAQGGTTGGTVEISTRLFRATDRFTASNGSSASLSTIGGQQGGAITIRHGGVGLIPFVVGDAALNGTAAAITSGNFAISPTQLFLFTETRGNISIISIPAPPIPPIPPETTTFTPSDPIDKIPTNPVLRLPNEKEDSTSELIVLDAPDAQALETSIAEDNRVTLNIEEVETIDRNFTQDFASYLGLSEVPEVSVEEVQKRLQDIETATGVKPAVIYAQFVPTGVESAGREADPFELELLLVTSSGRPIRRDVGVGQEVVLSAVKTLHSTTTNPARRNAYLAPAQQMYRWLIEPIEEDLRVTGIENLVFVLDAGLRSLPLAVLHNGQEFIIEEYSIGLMPSLALTDTRYTDLRRLSVLAMGVEQFEDKPDLPAVPIELNAIVNQLWPGMVFLNEDFTLNNLKTARAQTPYGIIHLATHGEFKTGEPKNSYLQLWEGKLTLDRLRTLGWHNPPVELLVLSACRTALGDEQAELGFAGLAVLAGVKSALGSLWYVSDVGTLGLMAIFYESLQEEPIKAEALRQAQLAMLHGQVRLEDGQLITPQGRFVLPPEIADDARVRDLRHPFYWSAFTLIGNPW